MARRERHNYLNLLHCVGGKTYAATRDKARLLRREVVEFKGSNNPVRFYKNRSGGWHWTQMADQTK